MFDRREKTDLNPRVLKLRALRRIAKLAFDDIDKGRFAIVDPDRLDDFMTRVDPKARASKS